MRLVGHELVSDLSRLVRNGYRLPDASYFCTSTAAQWLYPDAHDYSLEHLSLRMTTMPQWRPIGSLEFEDFDNLSDEALGKRCGGDAEAALRLYPRLRDELRDRGLQKVWRLAMAILPVLATIGGTGMAVDRDELADRAVKVGEFVRTEKVELEQILGIKSEPDAKTISHDQLAAALFGPPFWATGHRKTKTGGWSTDRMALLWARYQAQQEQRHALDTLLTRLLDYGEQSKLHSTYYKAWLDTGEGLRVYSCYSLGRTATGRLSSYDTNLQNIPQKARELIIPSDGYDLICQADFAQLEWRIGAHLSQDRAMLEGIAKGLDAHSLTAATALGLPRPSTKQEFAAFKEKYAHERSIGKMTNFACLFGVSDESLAWQIFEKSEGKTWIGVEQAKKYVDAFNTTFSGWEAYSLRLRQQNPLRSETGRTWWLGNSDGDYRKRKNYPVQSLASDLVLMVLWNLFSILKRDGWKTRIIGEVHDSIVMETTKKELPELTKLLHYVCEHPDTSLFGFKLTVPLAIEIQQGLSWGTLAA